ncbi:YfiR family protein [Duganella sp. LjRoot269]|jgi:hypothetical protein|uniref:YfiR family protein n=1 Tax=Duganella sp. LjRoot269 TaxID=3342305 RepID=UPI00335BC520
MEILTRPLRALARPVLLLLLALAWRPLAIAADADTLEFAVKGAYLTKFGLYVEWPPGVFAAPASPLVLCVVGDDPFGAALDSAVGREQVDGHPLQLRRLKSLTREAGCHVAYVGAAEAPRGAEALRGVLTVGEARSGGVISFVIKDNRVRFTVDDEAAARNGLQISSKLLNMALSVKPRPGKEGH